MRRVQQISEARAKANRQNASKSTGPKTAAGKILSRLNAATHGVLSSLQVLPHVERQCDWEAHCRALFADLKPVGYLETSLVERITLYFWRLGRVARHEREVVAIRQESLAEEIAESRREKAKINRLCEDSPMPVFGVSNDMHPDEVISRPGKAKKELALLEGFPKVPDTAVLTPSHAMMLIGAIEGVSKVDMYDEDFPSFPGVPDNVTLDDFDKWTAGIVRGAWKVIATAADMSLESLYAMAVTRARGELAGARAERKQVLTQLDRGRRLRLLPGNHDLEMIGRYESHIERGLYRALHELQRLQAVRVGLIAPPLAVDVTLAGRGSD
jgi:hypothetical protein